jgi:hypothetical protein
MRPQRAGVALLVTLFATLWFSVQAEAIPYRWPIKTGSDAGAKLAHPKKTPTVAQLARIKRPAGIKTSTLRLSPVEQTIYTIKAKLLLCRREADGDIHLVLQDLATDSTIVAEIPNPTKVATTSPWRSLIAKARTAFTAQFHPTNARKDEGQMLITVRGVGFFDKRHDSEGAATNGLELHPILSYSTP